MTRRLNGVFTVLANADRVVPAPRSGALPGVGPRQVGHVPGLRSGALPGVGPRPIGVVPEGER
jgi:hypothetical protein